MVVKKYKEDGEVILDAGEPRWKVVEVTPNNDYTLKLVFADGAKRTYDCKKPLGYKVFEPLNDIDLFMQAHTNGVTVIWNDQIDLSPETLYEESV